MYDVYVYGSDECDQFGIPDFANGESKIPRKVPLNTELSFNKVFKICCGAQHTLVLTTLGKMFSWGNNDIGALGRTGAEREPLPIETIEYPMNNMSAGDSHSIAYNSDLGLVYRWGCYRNNNGELHEPIRIPELINNKHFGYSKRVNKIVSGANHTLAMIGENLYAWGNDEFGQTGINPKAKRKVNALIPHKMTVPNVQDVFTALNHSFLIYKRGKGASMKKIVKAWGFNTNGQLGLGNWENQWVPQEITYFTQNQIHVVMATGGDHHSLFLSDRHEVYVSGFNREGQCGIDTPAVNEDENKDVSEPLQSEAPVLVIAQTGMIVECESNQTQTEVINKLASIPMVTRAEDYSGSQQDEDRLKSQDEAAIMTLERPTDSIFVPVKIEFFNESKPVSNIYSSMDFNYALDSSNNQVYSWGFGSSYVLANKQERNENYPFTISKEFYFNNIVEQISLGASHVVVSLFDLNSNLPKPNLEYDIEPYREALRKKVEERKTKSGKRKFEVSLTEEQKEVKELEEKISPARSLRTRTAKKSEELSLKKDEIKLKAKTEKKPAIERKPRKETSKIYIKKTSKKEEESEEETRYRKSSFIRKSESKPKKSQKTNYDNAIKQEKILHHGKSKSKEKIVANFKSKTNLRESETKSSAKKSNSRPRK